MTGRVEWLLAEIAEEERIAREAAERQLAGSASPWVVAGNRDIRYANGGSEDVVAIRVEHPAGAWERIYVKRDDGTTAAHIARWDPARVLAECNAKRRIIEVCVETLATEDSWDYQLNGGSGEEFANARFTLKMLASPFEGRPGYQETWEQA